MLAGQPPFEAPTLDALAAKVHREKPTPLPPNVPAALLAIVQRLLAKSPSERFATWKELRAKLMERVEFREAVDADMPLAGMAPGTRTDVGDGEDGEGETFEDMHDVGVYDVSTEETTREALANAVKNLTKVARRLIKRWVR